jgi:hypothetical protein
VHAEAASADDPTAIEGLALQALMVAEGATQHDDVGAALVLRRDHRARVAALSERDLLRTASLKAPDDVTQIGVRAQRDALPGAALEARDHAALDAGRIALAAT